MYDQQLKLILVLQLGAVVGLIVTLFALYGYCLSLDKSLDNVKDRLFIAEQKLKY